MFGDLDYDPAAAYADSVPLEEQLEALCRAQAQGKVRHVGLSNETPWGLMRALGAGEARCGAMRQGLPTWRWSRPALLPSCP